MFGYINIYKPELKVKDFYKYKAYYCGLCKSLKGQYGPLGQMTLTYDMTFIIILLTSLYENKTVREENRCLVHPVKKHSTLTNEITSYAADMNIALTYHHFLDDWQDDKSPVGIVGAKLIERAYKRIIKKYPRQCEVIEKYLNAIHIHEKNNELNIDLVAGCFGEIMGELMVYKEDIWEESLRKLGFYLGKFIYIIDAYEDIKKDIEKNSYNPLIALYKKETYQTECEHILTMMMAECTNEFEKLPCVVDIDILRNILYEGVWVKYDKLQQEKNLQEGILENGSL